MGLQTGIGPSSDVEKLLQDYGLGAGSLLEDVFQSDTDRLLVALILEQRDQDWVEALDDASTEYEDTTATYWTNELTASEDWAKHEFGFVTDSIDLRVSNANVQIAFADPTKDDVGGVPYTPDESPIVGVPAETSKVWVRRAPSAGSDATVQVDAWGE